MKELLTYTGITKALPGTAEDGFLSLFLFFPLKKKKYDTCFLKIVDALKLHIPFVSKSWETLVNRVHVDNTSEWSQSLDYAAYYSVLTKHTSSMTLGKDLLSSVRKENDKIS